MKCIAGISEQVFNMILAGEIFLCLLTRQDYKPSTFRKRRKNYATRATTRRGLARILLNSLEDDFTTGRRLRERPAGLRNRYRERRVKRKRKGGEVVDGVKETNEKRKQLLEALAVC